MAKKLRVSLLARAVVKGVYPKYCAAVEPFLLAFSVSYMLESGVSHAIAFLKQMNRLTLKSVATCY